MIYGNYSIATVPPEQLQNTCLLLRFHKAGRSCSPRLEKLSLFSPPPPCARRMARGFRCLRAAIRAARPHLGSIFEKLLHRKTFYLPAACPRNTSRNRFGKAGAHPQLAWESQLPLKPYLLLQPFTFESNCDPFDSLLDFCLISLNSFYLLRKCGLLAHTSAAFLKNCCTEKLFICLRLEICYLLSV